MNSLIKNIASSIRGKLALSILLLFILIAILAPFIASDPSVILEGATAYKAPGYVNPQSGKTSFFGTDQIGRDVWSGIIYGTRWALIVGFLATLISSFIGIVIGVMAGYFGDKGMKVNIFLFCLLVLSAALSLFYIYFANWSFGLKAILSFIAMFLQVYLYLFVLAKSSRVNSIVGSKAFNIPMDFLMLRLIEIWRAVPGLFILLALLAAVKHPSLWTLILILGVLRWTVIARLVRAELLLVREQNYIKSAKALGFSDLYIIVKHAMPNVLSPLFVVFAFSVSGAIVLEATISFLGIGVSADTVTWGSLMSAARDNYRAWWLAVFPGLCIFLLLISLNIIGDSLARSD